MKLSTPIFAAATLAGAALLALSAPLAASAHVEVDPSSAAAGSYSLLTFSVGHGCDGSATTALTIDIPEPIASVTPTVNPGWDVTKVEVDLAEPTEDSHGDAVSTRVGQIRYTALAPLADGLRTTFELSLQIPADAAVGDTLAFPVLQSCEVGETNWSEAVTEGEAEPAHPAPTVTVAAAAGETGHDHGTTDTTAAASTTEPASGDDVLARVLGIGGLVVGAIGLVVAVASRRQSSV
jgi:uncharacterized protein YcnI